jgi:hypothetical protein
MPPRGMRRVGPPSGMKRRAGVLTRPPLRREVWVRGRGLVRRGAWRWRGAWGGVARRSAETRRAAPKCAQKCIFSLREQYKGTRARIGRRLLMLCSALKAGCANAQEPLMPPHTTQTQQTDSAHTPDSTNRRNRQHRRLPAPLLFISFAAQLAVVVHVLPKSSPFVFRKQRASRRRLDALGRDAPGGRRTNTTDMPGPTVAVRRCDWERPAAGGRVTPPVLIIVRHAAAHGA